MSESNAPTPAAAAAEVFGDVRKNWGWLLGLGILAILLGTAGLGRAFAVTIASMVFFGWLILLAGVFELAELFQCKGWKSVLWQALIAVLHILAGVCVLRNPLLASGVFTLLLAASIFAGGVLRIVLALQHRDHGAWVWALIGGVAGVALGGMIASGWPASSLFVIGLLISIELILHGWTMVALALAARSAGGAGPEPQPA
jgi:uncharacterized membrane protein HdeD (DUF308 family)